jgi:MYXO-CTERM domain-containing protein
MRSLRRTVDRSKLSMLLVLAAVALPSTSASALDPFVDATAMLNNPDLTSGVAIAVADMDGNGLDDIVRLDDTDTLQIEYQQDDGSFVLYDFGFISGASWSIAIADVDGNGYADIYTGGAYDETKILLANATGDEYTLTNVIGPDVFAQCSSFADMDNNGTLDLFVCHDDGLSAPFNGDGAGNFSWDLALINPQSDGGVTDQDHSGNYGNVWTDYDNDGDIDLYIAKCRLGINQPDDPRRLNVLYRNDGGGAWTQVAADVGLQPQQQSWAMDFADIDNDGDMDAFLLNHSSQMGVLSRFFENMGPADVGMFQDITMATGVNADLVDIDLGIQAHFEDFDNDTFVDLLVTGRSGEHRLFFNNGDHTFTPDLAAFPTGGLAIQSAAVGDLDGDGFPDVVAGFATNFNTPSGNPDRLFLNAGNANNYIDVQLTGMTSNLDGIGARIEIVGEWGTQIRDVRAGESYGINNSRTAHFGLGTSEAIETLTVRWPSGQVDVAENPPVNVTVQITETCPDVFYTDADGDGYGDPDAPVTACLPPEGAVEDMTDCADDDANAFPDNPEACDGIDNDCDGEIDEDFPATCGGGSSSGGAGTDGSGDGTSAPGDASADGTGGTGGSDDGAAENEDDGGCGCRTDDRRSGPGLLMLLGLWGLAARRRRA